MPRAGLNRDAVVAAALAIIDDGGPEALTLAAVAARTGVATPSLYKHVKNLGELRNLLAVRLFDEFTDRATRAVLGRSRDEAVEALMRAYHEYATEHPHRYAIVPQRPDPDPAVQAAGERFVALFFAVLKGYGLDDDELVHATRVARATLHGFAMLQIGGGFGLPQDVAVTHQRLIDTVLAGLRATRGGAGSAS
ncbi:TetR-like C-terminal domain-containing protein [Dactylosporangium sucinum]|uniref:TetR family transcriptional regulator n=1 Tax=Dactylosporangium sucinum TaxID=1424081 RepID=A0A917T278_9ACTN|nr:TetR-like C-terminal domain-containing protein [Dactylosporangium sucinum]GGM08132.1 TetR family transcriptional regulator [Dactylosporangium sucinum]